MSYRVEIAREAEKLLDRLDRITERRIRARLLTERAGVRKSRVGGWRILFTVDRESQVIYIATVGTRGQIYKRSG